MAASILTKEFVKNWLKIDTTFEDNQVEFLIRLSKKLVQDYANRPILETQEEIDDLQDNHLKDIAILWDEIADGAALLLIAYQYQNRETIGTVGNSLPAIDGLELYISRIRYYG